MCGEEVGRVFSVADHEIVALRRDNVGSVLEVLRQQQLSASCSVRKQRFRKAYHLTVFEQIVEERQHATLDALDAVEDEDLSLFCGPHGARIDVLEPSARADLAALLELSLARVAV